MEERALVPEIDEQLGPTINHRYGSYFAVKYASVPSTTNAQFIVVNQASGSMIVGISMGGHEDNPTEELPLKKYPYWDKIIDLWWHSEHKHKNYSNLIFSETYDAFSKIDFSNQWIKTVDSVIQSELQAKPISTQLSDLHSISRQIYKEGAKVPTEIMSSLDDYMLKQYPRTPTLPGRI